MCAKYANKLIPSYDVLGGFILSLPVMLVVRAVANALAEYAQLSR
jgi:hypothetical protein